MWIRQVQIIVTNSKDPSKKTVFEKHSIDFEVSSVIGWSADTAAINIYNLDIDEIKFLQNKSFGDLLIEIRAGYVDELVPQVRQRTTNRNVGKEVVIKIEDGGVLPTLFSGVITNCVSFKRSPEQITCLFCLSKAAVNSSSFIQMKPIPDNATLRTAIKSMCQDYGFNTISTFGITDAELDVKLPHGRVFHDTFLNEFNDLLGEHNMQAYIATAEVQIFSDAYGDKDAVVRMAANREPIKLDANAVIGNPVAGIGIFDVNIYLRADVQPGMVMDVSPLLGTQLLANGVVSVSNKEQLLNYDSAVFQYAAEDKYHITKVVHVGGTHQLDFQTRIHGRLGGNNAMGLDESSWQNWYASSGMDLTSNGFD